MSTVISVVENPTTVTSNDVSTEINTTSITTIVSEQVAGIQGPTGPTGPSGVIGVVAPITNTGTSTAATIGINQAGLSLTPSQIVGTAYTRTNKDTDEYRLTNTYDIVARPLVGATRSLSTGAIYATLFTAQNTFTMSNFQTYCVTGGTVLGGTNPVFRMGLFTVSGNTLTLVARTANDLTMWGTSNTLFTRALSTVGGYPSSYTLNAGTTYAVGCIAYAGNPAGTFVAPVLSAYQNTANVMQPYILLGLNGQTDLPTAPTNMSTIFTASPFARLT